MRALAVVVLVLAWCSKSSAPTDAPLAASSASAPTAPLVVDAGGTTPSVAHAPTSLADFVPPAMNGTPLEPLANDPMMAPPAGGAVGAYLNRQTRVAINVNLMPVTSLKFSKAQFHDLKPGQTKDVPSAHLKFAAFDVGGYIVERTEYVGSNKSEAKILLADKVDVMVSVQPSTTPDDAVELMKQLDLKGIEAFAKTMGAPTENPASQKGL
ncbi:MAG TPA: hypothetical protein VF407_24530 [Polyangiaceae bacterium]